MQCRVDTNALKEISIMENYSENIRQLDNHELGRVNGGFGIPGAVVGG